MKFILLLMMLTMLTHAAEIPPELVRYKHNKQIPAVIELNVLKALSYYPELEHTHIRFVFKKRIKGSVMQAQPRFSSLLQGSEARAYQINISSVLRLTHSATPIHQLPDSIMIGWIGHELGHVMDYERRSNLGVIWFGISYLTSKKFRRQGEKNADHFAVKHGLGKYIIETKRFILDHAELPSAYKEKIARLYLSPEDIVEAVKKHEEARLEQQKKEL